MNNLKYSRTACLLWRYLRREFFDEFAVTRVHDKRIKWFWMTAACYFCWFAWKPKRSRSHSSKTTSLLLLSHPVASPTTERERETQALFFCCYRGKNSSFLFHAQSLDCSQGEGECSVHRFPFLFEQRWFEWLMSSIEQRDVRSVISREREKEERFLWQREAQPRSKDQL